MNIGILYYIAGICNNIEIFTTLVATLGIILSIVLTAFYYFELKDSEWNSEIALGNKFTKLLKFTWPISIACLIVTTFMPNKKEIIAMYIVPKIENNEKAMKITDKALDKILDLLEADGKCKEDE